MSTCLRLALAAAAFAAAAPACALGPSEVFEKVAPSVWAVHAIDSHGKPFGYGSAVVIGPGRLITNCHVLVRASAIKLRREKVLLDASLEHADAERDLCTLLAAGLQAPPVEIVELAAVRIGQRVYAVGNPIGLALTLSEGLISGLRSEDPGLPSVQTTAPISPGSSGGGLFDDRGRLVGITTLILADRQRLAQSLNFAAPAEWIREVPGRAALQLAKLRAPKPAPAAGASASLPKVGTAWRYQFRDAIHGGTAQAFTVRVTAVDGLSVKESTVLASGASAEAATNAEAVQFVRREIDGAVVIELAPYILSVNNGSPPAAPGRPPQYPDTYYPNSWRISAPTVDSEPETMTVRAGSFKAFRIEVRGENPTATAELYGASTYRLHPVPTRFEYTAWYAPEVNRYVMIRHRTWGIRGRLGDEEIELLEYKPN